MSTVPISRSVAAASAKIKLPLSSAAALRRYQLAAISITDCRKMKGNDYLQQFALPSFFFFVTTAYNILRHRGVPLGKRDFLGPVNWL
jgi:hypothetical protein